MVVALDRSTGMNQPFSNAPMAPDTTHLSAALHALYSNVGLHSPGGDFRPPIGFWFVDFPNGGAGCAGLPECCAKEAVHTTSFASFQATTSCETSSNACVSSADRPAAAALDTAGRALGNLMTPGSPRYVLLLTDGDPKGDCSSDECSAAIREADALRRDNIRLLIVAIGNADPSSSSCLYDIANAANGNTSPPYLVPAATANGVSIAVGNAMATALCNGTVTNPPPALNAIRVGNVPYSGGTTDDWTYDARNGRLHLHGQACQNYVQFGAVQVYADCTPGRGGPGFP